MSKQEYWYQTPYNTRNPKLKHDTQVRGKEKQYFLPKGTYLQPIRHCYLPYGHWTIDMIWSEKEHVVCYVESHGYLLVEVTAIDFTK